MEKKREERKCARVVGRGTLEKEEGKVEGKTPTTLLQFFSLPKNRAQASTQNIHGKTKSLDEDNRARDTAQSLCVVILGDIPQAILYHVCAVYVCEVIKRRCWSVLWMKEGEGRDKFEGERKGRGGVEWSLSVFLDSRQDRRLARMTGTQWLEI